MIKYYAVFDISRDAFCTDLIPCDDDVIAIRWFAGFLRNSNYAITCPKHGDLVLYCVAKWDSQTNIKSSLVPCDDTITTGDPEILKDDYNRVIHQHAMRIDDEAEIPDIKPMSDGEYRRAIERQKKQDVKDE